MMLVDAAWREDESSENSSEGKSKNGEITIDLDSEEDLIRYFSQYKE